MPAEKQVPVTDLELLYNKEEERLVLMHRPSGKETYLFDLGFQGHKGRSQLFQLLSKFSLANHLYWKPLTVSLNNSIKAVSKDETVTILPRITFEENIVLQRKTWVVKKDALPVFDPNEPEEESFLKVSLWKRKVGLPDEVFVFLTTFPEMDTLKPEQMARIGRDSYKPQYINFNNPLLINLLVKMIEKVPVTLKIEEMAPGSSELLEVNGEKFVSEFVLQWYDNYKPVENPAGQDQHIELSKIS